MQARSLGKENTPPSQTSDNVAELKLRGTPGKRRSDGHRCSRSSLASSSPQISTLLEQQGIAGRVLKFIAQLAKSERASWRLFAAEVICLFLERGSRLADYSQLDSA